MKVVILADGFGTRISGIQNNSKTNDKNKWKTINKLYN